MTARASFFVDGPVQNGCPREELTPPELFVSSIAVRLEFELSGTDATSAEALVDTFTRR